MKGRADPLVQRFLNIRDGRLRKSFVEFGNQPVLNLLVQRRADLSQGLGIGNQDKCSEVSAVSTVIELIRELLGEGCLVSFVI